VAITNVKLNAICAFQEHLYLLQRIDISWDTSENKIHKECSTWQLFI